MSALSGECVQCLIWLFSVVPELPGMLPTDFLNDFEMVPVAPIITGILLLLLLLLLFQLSFHSVAVVLRLVQTKQIIYINETIQKHSSNNTEHSKYVFGNLNK